MLQRLGQKLRVLEDQSGSTLLESVISLVLFTFIMTMVVSSFSTSNLITMRAQDTDNAANQAMRDIERASYDSGEKKKDLSLEFENVTHNIPVRLVGEANGDVTFWKFTVEEVAP